MNKRTRPRHKAPTALLYVGLDPDYDETDIWRNYSCRLPARGAPGGRIDQELERETLPSVPDARIPIGSSRIMRRASVWWLPRQEIEQPPEDIWGFCEKNPITC